jgi:hypothetical protein
MRLVDALGLALTRSGCDRRSDVEKAKTLTGWEESHPELAGLDPVGLSPDQWGAVVGPPVVPAGRGWSGRADQLRELALACALLDEPDPTRDALAGRRQGHASGIAGGDGRGG